MSQIILYQSEDERTKLDVRLENQTVWLSQKQLTELFGKAKGTISEHIKHIFEDGELEPAATVRLFRTVQTECGREVTRQVECYNLDMVQALGFRVRSRMAVRFRQWAADKLKEYIVKGFVLDDERLKNPDSIQQGEKSSILAAEPHRVGVEPHRQAAPAPGDMADAPGRGVPPVGQVMPARHHRELHEALPGHAPRAGRDFARAERVQPVLALHSCNFP
ncbi:hypothetical protein BH23VER1_BH23VER1_13230 [soil metagenome]